MSQTVDVPRRAYFNALFLASAQGVLRCIATVDESNCFAFSPTDRLHTGTQYTISIVAFACDASGNYLAAPLSWTRLWKSCANGDDDLGVVIVLDDTARAAVGFGVPWGARRLAQWDG